MIPPIGRTLGILAIAGVAVAASTYPINPATGKPERPISGYIPNRGYSVAGLLLFGLLASIQWIQFGRMGKKFMLVLSIGTTCMTIGFVLRIVQYGSPFSLGIYIIQQLFILLSPCAFLATDYVLLDQLATHLGPDVSEHCLLIPARRLVKIFVWSDVSTFLLQAAGGGLSAIASLSHVGESIALAGLCLQCFSFSLFTSVLLLFGWRVRRSYNALWRVEQRPSEPSLLRFWSTAGMVDWRVLYFTMSYTCIGILIRSVYRICEYAEGYNGYIPLHEAFFYLLDSLPLWLAVSAYCFIWPPRWLQVTDKDGIGLGEMATTNGKS